MTLFIVSFFLIIIGCVSLAYHRDDQGKTSSNMLIGGSVFVALGVFFSSIAFYDLGLGKPVNAGQNLENNAIYEVVGCFPIADGKWGLVMREQGNSIRLYEWEGTPQSGIVKAIDSSHWLEQTKYELKPYPAPPTTQEKG